MLGIEARHIGGTVAIAAAMGVIIIQPGVASETLRTGPQFSPAVASVVSTAKPQAKSVAREGAKSERGVTFGAAATSLVPGLDGVKVLGWRGPGAEQKSGFDMTVELHGLGVQFEEQGTYGFIRADRAFSGSSRVGIQFRFRF